MRRLQRSGTERLTSLQISQYTLESGESACTSICCKAAIALLRAAQTQELELMDPDTLKETLSEALFAGVELYERAKTQVQHAAVDEVLSLVPELRAELKVLGNMGMQGVLEPGSTSSLREVFQLAASHSDRDGGQYVAIVLTKPPESVLVLYPPPRPSSKEQQATTDPSHDQPATGKKDDAPRISKKKESIEADETSTGETQEEEAGSGSNKRAREEEKGSAVGSSSTSSPARGGVADAASSAQTKSKPQRGGRYHLFDSHPRPQLGITGAYLYSVDTEADLLDRLALMLPHHQFGDGDEGLSLMYNAFEATPLQLFTADEQH